MLKFVIAAAFAGFLSASGASIADDAGHKKGPAKGSAAQAVELSTGEIRKIDKEAGKIAIKHGEIKNLGMPPMTMVFKVSDPKMLEQVKVGDKVKFQAENPGGALTVTKIAPAK